MPRKGKNHPLVVTLAQTTVVLVLLTVGYYLLPLRVPWGDAVSAGRLAGSLLAWAALVVLLRAESRRSRLRQEPRYHRVQQLLTALYLLVLAFALLYVVTATVSPTEFAGLANRTDALYFSVTIMGTVGFGDVHAAGTAARLMVTVQMLFNLIYLGTALRVLSAGISRPEPD
jgi:succinate dehydrogenase hydrophobic anchor subunit